MPYVNGNVYIDDYEISTVTTVELEDYECEVTVEDFFYGMSEADKEEMTELLSGVGHDIKPREKKPVYTDLEQAVISLTEAPDEQFFGLTDEDLDKLRSRLNAQRPVQGNNLSVLCSLIQGLEPNQPVEQSMLNELKLLANQ